jgi:hypothetical protein
MKRRNTYTLTGGENMQRRNPGKAMRYRVAVCALVSALAMFGCGGGGGDDGGDASTTSTSNVSNVPVPVNATTVQAVVGQQFTIPNGAIFSPGLGTNPAVFTFTSPTTFSVTSVGSTASGNVAFGSCTLTVTLSGFPPAIQGLQVGNPPISFTTCSIQITASNVAVGGGAVSGTLTLTLGGANGTSTSLAITVQVSIQSNGTLVINGVATGITISGTTGTTGTGGTP